MSYRAEVLNTGTDFGVEAVFSTREAAAKRLVETLRAAGAEVEGQAEINLVAKFVAGETFTFKGCDYRVSFGGY